VSEGAEAFVALLSANGVSHIFLNPGTDTFPIQEAISKFQCLGRPCPDLVLCLNESLALAAAHGYFMMTGRPQVVLVHVDVGTLQLGGMLHIAQRGRTGVVICAGRSPWLAEGDKRGRRDMVIHWQQEQMDQGSIVRQYTKWDYELRSNENMNHIVQRAFQVASSEPAGPVYLTLPRELLMENMTATTPLTGAQHGAVISPQAPAEDLARAAELLIQADNPLLVTAYAGRNPDVVAPLVALAETLAIRVVSFHVRLNFPTDHPLWAGPYSHAFVPSSDVIMVVDHDVPYIPGAVQPRADAKIIYLDIDPLKTNSPIWDFPADLRIQADSAKAIPALLEVAQRRIGHEDKARLQKRLESLKQEHQAKRLGWIESARAKAEAYPISPEWLAYCIAQEVDDKTIVLEEAVSNAPHVVRQLRRTRPGTIFRSGGSHLGWGLGAALGAKLATPERMVVCLVADGSFIFGHPIETLWASAQYQAPFLAVVFNNGGYNAPKQALIDGYGTECYAAKTSDFGSMLFTFSPDYAMVAQSVGAYGMKVEDPGQIRAAIKEGLARVKAGQAAVLDIKLEKPESKSLVKLFS
jgi:acetolactate synthase-1/2/3 large subunit